MFNNINNNKILVQLEQGIKIKLINHFNNNCSFKHSKFTKNNNNKKINEKTNKLNHNYTAK